MDLEDAVEQYAVMVLLGSQALQRLIDNDANRQIRQEVTDLISGIINHAERLKVTPINDAET